MVEFEDAVSSNKPISVTWNCLSTSGDAQTSTPQMNCTIFVSTLLKGTLLVHGVDKSGVGIWAGTKWPWP